ncbi:hypothetical protein Q4S16_11685 [Morganella morganii]
MKSNKVKKPFDIPSFSESVKKDFEAGLITLKEAAIEFYKNNNTFYVDIEYTKKSSVLGKNKTLKMNSINIQVENNPYQ